MPALSRTLPVLIAASVLLLAGCEKLVEKTTDKASEKMSGYISDKIDEPTVRSVFTDKCVESNNALLSKDTAAKLCSCTYDRAASTYDNPKDWSADVFHYNLNPNNKELGAKIEAKFKTAMAACIERTAGQTDEQQARSTFIENCTKLAVEASEGKRTNEAVAQACGCTHDRVAASYNNPEEWKKDLIRYSISQADEALDAKFDSALSACFNSSQKTQH